MHLSIVAQSSGTNDTNVLGVVYVIQMVPCIVFIPGLTQVSEQTMSMPVHFIFIAQ